jgi:hypothetical protein
LAGDQALEQGAVETAGGAVIDVLDGGLMSVEIASIRVEKPSFRRRHC